MNEKIKEAAKQYAERVCSGEFPITYSREQVVAHTANDYEKGSTDFRDYVLSVLQENYEASKHLTDEDKVRTAQDIVNETYEDLIFIFSRDVLEPQKYITALSIVYWNNARNMTQEQFSKWLTADK